MTRNRLARMARSVDGLPENDALRGSFPRHDAETSLSTNPARRQP